MRIIHTGDLHLDTISEISSGSKAISSGSSSAQRWRTFQRLISYTNDWAADLLLVSGDLFHRQPNLRQLREVNGLFADLVHTQVVIIAGNHDFLSPGSPMADYPWCDHITLLPTDPDSRIAFPELNTVVHGFSYSSFQTEKPFPDEVSAPQDDQYHILMLHGGDALHLPLNFSVLEHSGFDYIALGHIHKPRIFPGRQMAYCGSPEPLDHTETGNHGFMQLDLTPNRTQLSFVPFSHTRYIPLSLQVTPEDTLFSLRKALFSRISKGSHGDLYSVTFTGTRLPEISICSEAFSDLPQIYEILDDTAPWYDFCTLLNQHRSDLVGQYIRSFLPSGSSEEELDEVHRQALYIGLQALLDTAGN
ncbi:MAG: DNA repair exonuclease [Lachnospiraceae bacterium]|nr:DNA repair exonuclease [Lachnospiraceae bacterium]